MLMKRYLTEAEQHLLLSAARKCREPLAQRDYHWMRLMIGTGIRVEEFSLLTLRMAEQALALGWLAVPAALRKGRKRGHEYLLTQTVKESLHALVMISRAEPQTPAQGEAPLVWGRDGHRLSVRSYQSRLKHWVHEAGLDPRVSVHWLRHTRGVNIIRRSRGKNPLKVAQEALGHSSIASTGIYTQMAREEYIAELQAIDGQRVSKAEARRLAGAHL